MIYLYYRHPFVNREGKFSVLKLAKGKYDLIEREEIDERLKKLSYRMIESEVLEENVLRKGMEKINREEEMEGLRKEIRNNKNKKRKG
jgi:hypothetical protein